MIPNRRSDATGTGSDALLGGGSSNACVLNTVARAVQLIGASPAGRGSLWCDASADAWYRSVVMSQGLGERWHIAIQP